MNKSEELALVQAFIQNGGEIIRLREASKADQKKSRSIAYHREKALEGNEKSRAIVEREEAREKRLIFGRIERNKA